MTHPLVALLVQNPSKLGHSFCRDGGLLVAHAHAPRGHVVTHSGHLQCGDDWPCEPHFCLGTGHAWEKLLTPHPTISRLKDSPSHPTIGGGLVSIYSSIALSPPDLLY